MKLHPMPEAVSAAICHFPTNEAAVDTVVQTMQSSLPIARIELLDTESVKVSISRYSKYLRGIQGVFIPYYLKLIFSDIDNFL